MIIIEMAKIELIGGHIEIMLIIEMAKIDLPGGHIGIMLIIEITKIELTDGHIGFFLKIEKAKIELTGGHIGIMLITKMARIELIGGHIGFIVQCIYIDYQNKINRRPYWNYAIYRVYHINVPAAILPYIWALFYSGLKFDYILIIWYYFDDF